MRQTEVLTAVGKYLAEHPEELVRIARKALALRVGVPLAAVRWVAARGKGRRLPKDVVVEAVPPGVRVAATVEVMGARLRASSVIFVEQLRLSARELVVELRFSEVELNLLGESSSPLAALLRSGALDLSKLGNLMAFMPRRPDYIVEARGDRIVFDLKRHPAFSTERADLLLRLITPIVTVREVGTENEHLDVKLAVFENGVRSAVASIVALL